MFNNAIKKRIEFIKKDCIQMSNSEIILEETKESGKAKLKINVKNPCIAFKCLDDNKLPYISWLKCADDIVFEERDGTWILHIIEFKSKVTAKRWQHIKEQFKGAILNSLSIAGYLGINFDMNDIKLYTGFKENAIPNQLLANPIMLKRQVGKSCCQNDCFDWNKGKVTLNILDTKSYLHERIELEIDSGEATINI